MLASVDCEVTIWKRKLELGIDVSVCRGNFVVEGHLVLRGRVDRAWNDNNLVSSIQ